MPRPGTMSGMHKDDLEKLICNLMDGRKFTDGLGNLVVVDAHREPGEEPVAILTQLEGRHAGRVEYTEFRIGR